MSHPPRSRLKGWTLLRLALVTIFFTAAPTAGDIGSCAQSPDELDPEKFYAAKEAADCKKCIACDLTSEACVHACEPELDLTDFPRRCFPLVHDGEVCLRKIDASSCSDFAAFVADEGATIPTECNFCPADLPGPGEGGSAP